MKQAINTAADLFRATPNFVLALVPVCAVAAFCVVRALALLETVQNS